MPVSVLMVIHLCPLRLCPMLEMHCEKHIASLHESPYLIYCIGLSYASLLLPLPFLRMFFLTMPLVYNQSTKSTVQFKL